MVGGKTKTAEHKGRKTQGERDAGDHTPSGHSEELGPRGSGYAGAAYISRAAATTAEVWWPQGFIPEEDTALKKAVADYEKASGNQIDLNIAPFAPQR